MSQLKAGALLSYLSIFISILIALLYTPFMIRILGQSEYGLYSVIGSLAAYFSVMDMGLGNALVRFTAKNRVDGDKNYESKLNGLFLMLYTIIGLLTVVVGVVVYNNINTLFSTKFTEIELVKAKTMVVILIINFALSFPLSIFSSIIKAYEYFVADKLVSIIRILLSPIIILPIIYIGYGAVSMVVITTVVNILSLLFIAMYCFRKVRVRFYIGKIDKVLLRQIVGYSLFVFLGVIVDQIYWQTDQIILGAVRGTATVAVYAVAMQFIKLYIQFSSSISSLFLPKVSMMVAKKASGRELTDMMIKFGRLQYIIITFIISGFVLFGLPFIEFWAGSNYKNAYYIIVIIMIPLTIPLIQNIGISILYAKNLQGFRSVMLIFMAVINVIISIPLAKYYGGIGVAIVTAITLGLGNILVMNIYYAKKIGLEIIRFWKSLNKLTVVIIVAILSGVLLNMVISLNNIYLLSIKIIVYSLIHISILYKIGFNNYEKDLFNSAKRKVIKLLKFNFIVRKLIDFIGKM